MSGGGLCILGDLTFRINPDLVDWSFQVYTSVQPTVGGRVVQVLGSALSDIVIHGYYGENNMVRIPQGQKDNSPGLSWRMAESFTREIRRLMENQSPPPGGPSGYNPPKPVRWFYPARGWDFWVYIKDISDARGGGVVSHQTGKFSYDYQITLFPAKDNTYSLTGDPLSLKTMQDKAVETAITRISDGLGWVETKYNAPDLHNQIGTPDANAGGQGKKKKGASSSAKVIVSHSDGTIVVNGHRVT